MKITGDLSKPEGIHPIADSVVSPEPMTERVGELQQTKASRLGELTDWVWFSIGVFYVSDCLDNTIDPVQDWVNSCKSIPVICRRSFHHDCVKGMPDEEGSSWNWNRGLLGIDIDHWESLRKYLGNLSFIDRHSGTFFRSIEQKIDIIDPLFFDTAVVIPEVPPRVTVTFFALAGNNRSYLVLPPTMLHVASIPKVVVAPGAAALQQFAEAVLADNAIPENREVMANIEWVTTFNRTDHET